MGTPLLTFGFQVGLVKDMPFGLAFSALGLGGFYLVVGTMLWRAGKERWRVLVQTFAVLGAIFGTLTIPFALDARWTSAAWALQGFGSVWFGLRHQRRAIWICGLSLQVAAWISFTIALSNLDSDAALTANLWLGFLLLAGSAYAVAVALRRPNGGEQDLSPLASTALVLAAAWLLAGWYVEAFLRFSGATLANWIVADSMLTALLLYAISLRTVWPTARRLVLAAQIAGAIGLAIAVAPRLSWIHMIESGDAMPLLGVVILAVAALATSRTLQRAAPTDAGSYLPASLLLWSGIWWVCALNVTAGRVIDYLPSTLGSGHSRWLALYALGIAATSTACVRCGLRFAWPQLRGFALVCWAAMSIITLRLLAQLYGAHALPDGAFWIAWAITCLSSEQAMLRWDASGSLLERTVLQILHTVRTAGPWLALWPTGAILIDGWLATPTDSVLILRDSWITDAAWSNYLPTWAMMLFLVGLLRRSVMRRWPTVPISDWYQSIAVPVGTVLTMLPITLWNLRHDGAMAPLPYLPLLNPLDLTTGFVLLLWVVTLRQLAARAASDQPVLRTLRRAGAVAAWLWFNLMLLRSAAHYLGIDCRLAELAASETVQALLSLTWGASAFVLMRIAARTAKRRLWWGGAFLYSIVVAKLFLVDLANGGSIARVVSFVGVGLLLLLVGYLAPYPKASQAASTAAPV
ncbi:putative membrane protein [Massilia sp. MP_M2]